MTDGRWRYVLTVGGRDLEFGEGEVTLGRSRTATVRVDHESVSRTHALLTFERGIAVLKDLNSSNGTFAGGKRILNETRLEERETIQLGAAVLSYRLISPDEPAEKTALLETGVGTIPAPVVPPEPPPTEGPAGEAARGDERGPEEAPAAAAPIPSVQAPGPLEISAGELLQAPGRREGRDEAQPLVARAALDAVRNAPDALPGTVSPPPLPPPPAAAPPAPAPRPSRPSSVAEVPLTDYEERPAFTASAPGAPAGFGQRLLAGLVDGVILAAINLLLLSPVILVTVFLGSQRDASAPRWEIVAITGLSAVLIVLADLWYTVGGVARSGRTPGKALMKIAVVGPAGTTGTGIGYPKALSRLLFQFLGSIPFCLGTFLMLVRKDRRTWHDLMSGTWVIRVG